MEQEMHDDKSLEDTASSEAQLLDEPAEAAFLDNVHYKDLIVYTPNCRPEPAFYSYEGLRRCHVCQLLNSSLHITRSEECGLERYPNTSQFCPDCGRPYGSGGKRKKDWRKHPPLCPKIWISEDEYDHTLHCPKCGTPGFAWLTINRHLKDCDGDRRSMLGKHNYHYQGMSVDSDVTTCPDCGFAFRNKIYGGHVCGAICDPVWVDDEIPDMTKPYIAWCAEHPEGLGYGGARVVNGLGAAIPQAVVEQSYHVPYAVKQGYSTSGPSQVARVFVLVRRLAYLIKRLWDTELAGIATSGQALIGVSVREMSNMTLDEKIVWLEDVCGDCMEVLNCMLLESRGVSFDNITTGPCPGVGWKHGWFPCLWNNTIDLRTVKVKMRAAPLQYLRTALPCLNCAQLGYTIWNWMARGKYNADGTRLCPGYSCRNPVSAGGIECVEHREKRQEANLSAAIRRAEKRGQQSAAADQRRKLHRLWKTVTPDLMQDFLAGLTSIHQLPWQHDSTWYNVAAGLAGMAGPPVFFVDTETIIVDHIPTILSIAIVNTHGSVLLHETVDYNQTISELCKDQDIHFKAYACRIYGATNTSSLTRGLTPDELRRNLENIGISPEAIVVEWSMSGWDWRAMRATFGEDLVADRAVCAPDVWRLSGYSGPRDLQTIYHLCFPKSNLNKRHHDADVDALKLYEVTRLVILESPGDERPDDDMEVDLEDDYDDSVAESESDFGSEDDLWHASEPDMEETSGFPSSNFI